MTVCRCFALLLGLVLVPLVSAGPADDQKPKRPDGPGGMQLLPPFVLERLDLSEAQHAQVAKLLKDFEEKNKDAFDKARKGMAKAQEMMERSRQNMDREAMRNAGEQMREAREGMRKLYTEFEGPFLGVLNEDQKKKLEELKKEGPMGRPGMRPPLDGGGQLLPPHLELLNLSPEQRDKLKQVQKEYDEKVRGVLTEKQKKQLEEFMQGGPPGRRPERKPE